MEKTNFYCQKKCGGTDYQQDQINEALLDCKGMNFSEEEIQIVKDGITQSFSQKCSTQCKTCSEIVLATQIKNLQKTLSICSADTAKSVINSIKIMNLMHKVRREVGYTNGNNFDKAIKTIKLSITLVDTMKINLSNKKH